LLTKQPNHKQQHKSPLVWNSLRVCVVDVSWR
jgi:hypothetical protein